MRTTTPTVIGLFLSFFPEIKLAWLTSATLKRITDGIYRFDVDFKRLLGHEMVAAFFQCMLALSAVDQSSSCHAA